MHRCSKFVAVGAVLFVSSFAVAVDVVPDGGDGPGEIGRDVFIGSGNATFDPNTMGDFRFNEQEAVNRGPLIVTFGTAGVRIQVSTASFYTSPMVTYENLWDLGILQADVLSGLDWENFGSSFSFTGMSGMAFNFGNGSSAGVSSVPEPGSMVVVLTALMGLVGIVRRRR